jgi:hypothetical protein
MEQPFFSITVNSVLSRHRRIAVSRIIQTKRYGLDMVCSWQYTSMVFK